MESLLAFAIVLAGTVVEIPPLERMVERSDVIIHAVVTDVNVVEEADGRLFTRTSVDVIDAVKGAKPGTKLVISQLGGSNGEHNYWISGAHRFQVGEEMIFFGARWRDGLVVPFGIGYGIFDVVDDGSGRRVVREAVGNVVVMQRGADGVVEGRPEQRKYDSVDAFKNMLRDMARRPDEPMERSKPRIIEQRPRVAP
jgi:hypothetical protein